MKRVDLIGRLIEEGSFIQRDFLDFCENLNKIRDIFKLCGFIKTQ